MAVTGITTKLIADFLLLLLFMLLPFSIHLSSQSVLSSHSLKNYSLPDSDPNIYETIGFTLPLFHMLDSPLSPYYSAEITDHERFLVFRDSLRTRNFTMMIDRKSTYKIRDVLPMTTIESGYLVSYGIGTPTITTFGLLDTGSYLTWIQ
ncbi:hypothetical protein MKX01_011096, partial [Papaver californicum]